mgnify:CR=1 FL=1
MHAVIDGGIAFFDNAWDYGMGACEEIMGKALAADGYRKKVFLMTKSGLLIHHVSRNPSLQKDDDIVASMFVATVFFDTQCRSLRRQSGF